MSDRSSTDRSSSDRSTGNRRRWWFVPLGAALASGLAIATHYEVLTYWFTGPDTLTLIETSRIGGSKSAIDTLTKPLMHGTNFVALTGKFYRPVASLSYAIEYWLWGLDPFGYHLTDLLAHATAAVLVVSLLAEQWEPGRSGTDERRTMRTVGVAGLLVATLAGSLFALHPLTAEVVPVPARRHDVLATVFVLASLWTLARGLKATHPGPKLRYLGLSLLAYASALGSKEVSAILPALAVAWVALDSYGRSGRVVWTVRRTVLVGIGYAVVSFAYLGLRVSLLGGIGGYVGPFGGVKDASIPLIVSQYFLSLLYPVDVLELGSGVEYVPATIYVVCAVWIGLLALGVVGTGGLRPFLRSSVGRLAAFYSVWLLLPLPLIVRVGEYSPWTGYIALVPITALCALVLTVAGRGLYRALARLAGSVGSVGSDGNRRPGGFGTLRPALGAGLGAGGSLVALALAAFLLVSLVAVSPLVQPYDGWEHAGEVTEEALTDAEDRIEKLPPEALLKVERLPNVVTLGPPTAEPRVKSLRYFWAHSLRSWVRLRNPESRLTTFTHGRTAPVGNGAVAVRVGVERRPNAPPVMRFRYESPAASSRDERGRTAESENASAVGIPIAVAERRALNVRHASRRVEGFADGRRRAPSMQALALGTPEP
jgi:hypothetical protein